MSCCGGWTCSEHSAHCWQRSMCCCWSCCDCSLTSCCCCWHCRRTTRAWAYAWCEISFPSCHSSCSSSSWSFYYSMMKWYLNYWHSAWSTSSPTILNYWDWMMSLKTIGAATADDTSLVDSWTKPARERNAWLINLSIEFQIKSFMIEDLKKKTLFADSQSIFKLKSREKSAESTIKRNKHIIRFTGHEMAQT